MSQSARIYAEMARREGYEVLAVDGFADADTQHAAQQVLHMPGLGSALSVEDEHQLMQGLDAWQPDALLTGSGFEANVAVYERLYQRYCLLGNAPAVIRNIKNPVWLKAHCDKQALSSPEIRMHPPLTGQWLHKQAGQCGGGHVQYWQTENASALPAEGGYWQAFQPGLPVGILFIAGQQNTLVGVHALKQRAGQYSYAGASRLHDDVLVSMAEMLLQKVTNGLGLVGIQSIDAIWHQGQLHLLEINPRLSASMRLYAEMPLIQAHVQHCRAEEASALESQRKYASHCIAYARRNIALHQLHFPVWLEDRPNHTMVAAGQPFFSLYAEGHSDSEVQLALQDKKTRLEKLWGTYVCDSIEFNIH